jgi:hypothetical protein
MCHYRGGLIGKHFKTLSQVMAFAVYNLVPREVLDAWLIIGCLTVLLWHTKIENIESYVVGLMDFFTQVMDIDVSSQSDRSRELH